MVTKAQLEEALDVLRTDIKNDMDKSISELREHVINQLIEANKSLQKKVNVLEDRVKYLERDFRASEQYNRLNNIVISGIPPTVDDSMLEHAVTTVMNTCLSDEILRRAIESRKNLTTCYADL